MRVYSFRIYHDEGHLRSKVTLNSFAEKYNALFSNSANASTLVLMYVVSWSVAGVIVVVIVVVGIVFLRNIS